MFRSIETSGHWRPRDEVLLALVKHKAAGREDQAEHCARNLARTIRRHYGSSVNTVSKEKLLGDLTEMLRDLFEQRNRGVPMSRLLRAHGYVDGYMRVLLDANLASKAELLALVASERESHDGPATRVEPPETVAA
jgi:hypothetical protein